MASKKDLESHEGLLFLPLDIVKSSPGFSFDIGSTLMKIVYRSKKDFCNGEPLHKEATHNGKGRVYLTSLPRKSGPTALAELILERCDVTSSQNVKLSVPVTGIGANLLQKELEAKLNVQLQIGMENVFFTGGFEALLEHMPKEELEYPHPEDGLRDAQKIEDFLRGWQAASGNVPEETYSKLTNLEHQLPEGDKPYLPCLLVCCGSDNTITLMNEKGELIPVDVVLMAGKAMMSFATYTLGKKPFNETMKEIELADGDSCDVSTRDIVCQDSDSDDKYGRLNSDLIAFYMGKLDGADPDKVKKADIARSMFRMGAQNLAQISCIYALAFGVRKIYFTGGFVSIPLARRFMTTEIEGKQSVRPKHQQVEYHFIRNGGYCGAVGVFLHSDDK